MKESYFVKYFFVSNSLNTLSNDPLFHCVYGDQPKFTKLSPAHNADPESESEAGTRCAHNECPRVPGLGLGLESESDLESILEDGLEVGLGLEVRTMRGHVLEDGLEVRFGLEFEPPPMQRLPAGPSTSQAAAAADLDRITEGEGLLETFGGDLNVD
ncbi:hypothetical protein AAVH_28942 [Aphelenchoides avenae]|nr:hypothetical protein AAVH_28942 [Aphelenchus avenae]